MPAFSNFSHWEIVLGIPSKITPFFDNGSFSFSLRILITISSETNFPEFTIYFISAISDLLKVEAAWPLIIFLISSPVEIWLYFKSFFNNFAYVPLPTPGAPNKIMNFVSPNSEN